MSESREGPSRPPLLDDHDRPGPPPLMSEEHGRMSKGLTVFIALFSLVTFGAIVWYAYDQGQRSGSDETTPLIRADETPVRVKPKNPGGMKIPHQDKMIFDQLSEVDASDQLVERLLPRPEEPALVGEKPPDQEEVETVASKEASPGGDAAQVSSIPSTKTVSNSGNETKRSSGVSVETEPGQRIPPGLGVLISPKIPARGQKLQRGAASKATTEVANALPASIKPTVGGGFRVQIGAFKSEGVARDVWRRAKDLHRGELGALSLSIQKVEVPGRGTFHRVQGGPLSKAQARSICQSLKALKQDCIVKRP